MSLKVEIKCKWHKQYQAKHKPRVDCNGCGIMWKLSPHNKWNVETSPTLNMEVK